MNRVGEISLLLVWTLTGEAALGIIWFVYGRDCDARHCGMHHVHHP